MYLLPSDRLLQIEVTTWCNLKCQGCARTVGIEAGVWKNKYLPIEDFRQIISHARPAQMISLQGIGEPTLHPQLPEMISMARESEKFHDIIFYSNALSRSTEYFADLKKRGLSILTISVDSLVQSVVDKCRAGTDVEKLYRRLKELHPIFAPRFCVSLVLSKVNLHDAFTTFEMVNAIGPMKFSVQKMIPTSEEIDRTYIPTEDEINEFKNRMRILGATYQNLEFELHGELSLDEPQPKSMPAPQKRPVMCNKPYLDRYVTIDGYLTPCCVIIDEDEWSKTRLDRAMSDILMNPPVSDWYAAYETVVNENCKTCSFNPGAISHSS